MYGCAARPHSWARQGRGTDVPVRKAQGGNDLTSTIPASWLRVGPFASLAYLGVAQNRLVGTIPTPEPGCALCGYNVSAPLSHQKD